MLSRVFTLLRVRFCLFVIFLTVLLCTVSQRSLWASDFAFRPFARAMAAFLSLRFLRGPHFLNTALSIGWRCDLVAVTDCG